MTPEDRFQSIDLKLDKLVISMHSIDKTVAKQEVNLSEHMRRTELAEAQIEMIRSDMKPIKTHVNRLEGGLKLLGIISIILTIVAGIYNLAIMK